jgi:hypothetical protein
MRFFYYATFVTYFLIVTSIRGLSLNLTKIPEASSLYCVVHVGGEQYFTKPFPYSIETAHASIPLHDEFSMLVDPDATVTVELRLRAEYRKTPRFNPQRMLRTASIRKFVNRAASSMSNYSVASGTATPVNDSSVISSIQEETLCKVELDVQALAQECSNGIVDRKFLWQGQECFQLDAKAQHRRARTRTSSRISEVGHYLFDKFNTVSKRDGSATPSLDRRPSSRIGGKGTDLASTIQLLDAGSIQLQAFYAGGLKSVTDSQKIPDKMHAVEGWLARKQWFKTTWYNGYLSQQGGDVKNWRRRFFKIVGAKMEAFHEFVSSNLISP